jgi:hypothetical protein
MISTGAMLISISRMILQTGCSGQRGRERNLLVRPPKKSDANSDRTLLFPGRIALRRPASVQVFSRWKTARHDRTIDDQSINDQWINDQRINGSTDQRINVWWRCMKVRMARGFTQA